MDAATLSIVVLVLRLLVLIRRALILLRAEAMDKRFVALVLRVGAHVAGADTGVLRVGCTPSELTPAVLRKAFGAV